MRNFFAPWKWRDAGEQIEEIRGVFAEIRVRGEEATGRCKACAVLGL